MSATSQYPAIDGIVGPYPTKKGERYGVRLKGFERFGLRTKADAVYKRDQYRTEKYEQTVSPEKFAAKKAKRVTIADLLQLVVDDFQRNDLKSLKDAKEHQALWTQYKGSVKASAVTGRMLVMWADDWKGQGYSAATINRRMAKLLRGYRIAMEQEPPLLTMAPKWKKLKESAARSGFLDYQTFLSICGKLPEYAQIPVTIAFWTGMRYGEIITITWRQVSFNEQRGTVRIQLGTTKNGQPRQVIMPGDLYTVLKAWKESSGPSMTVCHRNGEPLKVIEDAWKAACVHLGLGTGRYDAETGQYREYQGPLFHDLRRTGVRNLISAGVDRDVAKVISGHRTDSVFSRYNIVNELSLERAGDTVVADIRARSGKPLAEVVSIGGGR